MGHVVLAGDPPIEITLRRTASARRLSLRVSRMDGRVTMSLPNWAAKNEALDFAREKEAWIRKNLELKLPAQVPAIGGQVLFEGRETPLVSSSARSVRYDGSQLLVPGPEERCPAKIAAYFKVIARQRLSQASDKYAARLGVGYSRLTLRDTRSRWGSCTTDANLMYSWRLIMAPPDVLDYVAAHEVSHLVEMNHSANYWAVVAGIFPDYNEPRKWLRKHGQQLHAYRFGN